VVEKKLIFVRLEKSIEGHGDGADLDRTEKGIQEFGSVEEQEQHPFLGTNVQRTEEIANAIDASQQLLIGDLLLATFDCRPGPVPLAYVAVDEKLCDIELFRHSAGEIALVSG
jgi:hypothetical protein